MEVMALMVHKVLRVMLVQQDQQVLMDKMPLNVDFVFPVTLRMHQRAPHAVHVIRGSTRMRLVVHRALVAVQPSLQSLVDPKTPMLACVLKITISKMYTALLAPEVL